MNRTNDAAPPPARGKGPAGTIAKLLAIALAMSPAAPALAQYRHEIANDLDRCSGEGSAVMVTVEGVKSSSGRLRVQTYRATTAEWMAKGKWLARVDVPARAGTMRVCLPVPGPGSYGVAVRHDVNGNGETDIMSDGGGMSNNPSINVFNLGKPNVAKVAFPVGGGPRAIRIQMKYM